MSNIITPQMIAAESLDQLSYELVAGSLVHMDKTSEFTSGGLKVGSIINVKTSTDILTRDFVEGVPIDPQEINESQTPLTIEKHFDASVKIGSKEKALSLDSLRKQVINPAMTSIAQKMDAYLLSKVVQSQGLYTAPVANFLTSAANIAQANKFANRQQINKTQRIALVNDEAEAVLLGNDVFTKFDTRGQPAVDALTRASLGTLLQSDWFSSNNFPEVSQATGDGTATLDNALATSNLQGSNTLIVDATVGTFNAGDKIELAGAKRAFTVTAQVLAGATSIVINEQINENLLDLDGAAVSVIEPGQTIDYQGVMFNRGAFTFAVPPLDDVPSESSAVLTSDGFSIRFVESYDINLKKTIWSFDVLVGAAATDPRRGMLLGSY